MFEYFRDKTETQLKNGIACYNCMDFDQAWILLNKAARSKDCRKEAYFYLQRLCFDLGETDHLQYYQSKLAFYKGLELLKNDEYKQAGVAFHRAAITPSAKIYYMLAVTYVKQKNRQKALFYIQKTLKKNPLYLPELLLIVRAVGIKQE